MRGKPNSIGLIRRAAWPALALLVVGTFAGHADRRAERPVRLGRLFRSSWKSARSSWRRSRPSATSCAIKSALLDPRKADPDLADEMVRKDLGLVRADEVVVPLED